MDTNVMSIEEGAVLVTGANRGIGRALTEDALRRGAKRVRVVVAEESINFALAALFNILFAGVTFMLLGLAVALSGEGPRGPAWAVVLAGVVSIPVGLVQASQGESVAFTRVATIITPTVITLWVVWMSVRLLRAPAAAANVRAAAARSIT